MTNGVEQLTRSYERANGVNGATKFPPNPMNRNGTIKFLSNHKNGNGAMKLPATHVNGNGAVKLPVTCETDNMFCVCAPRREYKYFVAEKVLTALRRDLLHFLKYDEHAGKAQDHKYTVRSLYYDTPSLRYYNEKLGGIGRRTKIRLRRYESATGKPSGWFLEAKEKFDDLCAKSRATISTEALHESMAGRGWPDLKAITFPNEAACQSFQLAIQSCNLEPKVLVLYDREAFVDPHSDLRVTIDTDVQAIAACNPYQEIWLRLPIMNRPVFEIKFRDVIPAWLNMILRKNGVVREPISKYCRGVEASMPFFVKRRQAASANEVVPSRYAAFFNQSYTYAC